MWLVLNKQTLSSYECSPPLSPWHGLAHPPQANSPQSSTLYKELSRQRTCTHIYPSCNKFHHLKVKFSHSHHLSVIFIQNLMSEKRNKNVNLGIKCESEMYVWVSLTSDSKTAFDQGRKLFQMFRTKVWLELGFRFFGWQLWKLILMWV